MALERHYKVSEIAEMWKMSDETVRKLFLNEPGVLVFGEGSRLVGRRYKRRYFSLRIPESVLERVQKRLLEKRGCRGTAARPPRSKRITLRSLPWTNATTYTDAPHEYVLRHQDPAAFDWFSARIKAEGVAEKFTLRGGTATYRYYYAGDGYKYWITAGVVLNRAKVPA